VRPASANRELSRFSATASADEHHNIIRYQCSPYHTNTALFPAINYLRQAAGFASNDSSNAKLNKLNVTAVEAGVENQKTVSLIADLLSIRGITAIPRPMCHPNNARDDSGSISAPCAKPGHSQCNVVHCGRCPLIDPTTRDLLTRIIDHIPQIRVLF